MPLLRAVGSRGSISEGRRAVFSRVIRFPPVSCPMKGSPPFTRHPVKLEFLTPQLAGLGEELRNAKILWRGESIKVLSTPRTAWLNVKPGTPACAAVHLIHEAHGLDEVKVQEKTPGISISARGSLG